MFRSLKLQINLFAFLPFVFMAIVGMYIQIATLNTINHHVSEIAEDAVIEVEKRRLVTVIDSSLSLLKPYLAKPGKEGLEDGLKMLYNYRFDNDIGYLFSYDKDGTRVMSGSNKGIGKNFINSQDIKGNFIVQNILNAAQAGGDFTTYYFPKKGETEPSAKYSYSIWIEQWGIAIATGFFIDGTEEILGNIDATLAKTQNDSIMQNLITVLIVSIVVALCVFFSVRMILTALGSLRKAVEDLADGEGDLTTTLPGSSLDILDDIAKHFNRFLRAMSEDITNLKCACEQLNEIAIESRKQNDGLTQSSDQQVQETTYIAAAVEEMSSTALEIAQNADNTRTSAEQTEQEVQDVLKQVQVSSNELNALSDVLLNVEGSVQELGGNVEEINSVLSVIQGISEQTNLLALNAAIEAARAGELGRGFAVVADEVRSLAQRSHESTQEIKTILEKLQTSAEKTIQDMSQTTEKRTTVVEAMERITSIIDSSSESIKNLTVMNVDVSNAATQQSTVVNDMAKNINGIADLAETIGKSSASAKEQFNRLEEQAYLVQSVTNKFKT